MNRSIIKMQRFRNVQGKRKIFSLICNIILYVFMFIVTIAILYPLLFVLTTSFKTYSEFLLNPFLITFNHPENYVTAWIVGHFGNYFMNSIIVAFSVVIIQTFLTAVISFAIGSLNFKGCNVVLFLLLSTMFMTGEMTSIPIFNLIREIGLYNKLGALILPSAFGPAGMGALLTVNFLRKLPREMHEAAVLDGAGIGSILWFIDLPLMRPMLTLVAITIFNGIWSDFMWPLIVLPTNDAAWTLPLGLINFQSQNNAQYGVLCAGLCIITIPLVLFYCFFSKYFIEGVTAGAVKG